MNLLLDTHILLWALAKPKQLPDTAVNAIYQANAVFFSPVNLWEIGIKATIWTEYGIKRIEDIHAGALKANLQELIVNSADAMLATQLPMIHRDPFDRLLIAQSHNNQYHLVTVDDKIVQYHMPYVMGV
ncbi:PilT protein domain protein, toxin of TAS system [Candidatus Methylobacter favarea]|uniref:PilT protein domain protein, toxin of TAS system n=1 Tax=Candidatus Methylobacter favarea TaxID=2707345 RepID=A0A8S0WCJ1_9GAMM|nr:type II toxin-antitoxin system VapC family toxin [Candidatus Methylobacter favarea]CAA9892565.1 PilT protein domain protein, toxin of TAS system [Candidatus Methylobacter favarea]